MSHVSFPNDLNEVETCDVVITMADSNQATATLKLVLHEPMWLTPIILQS